MLASYAKKASTDMVRQARKHDVRKFYHRNEGKDRAIDKLAKESLNELHRNTLVHYLDKVTKSDSRRAAKDGDENQKRRHVNREVGLHRAAQRIRASNPHRSATYTGKEKSGYVDEHTLCEISKNTLQSYKINAMAHLKTLNRYPYKGVWRKIENREDVIMLAKKKLRNKTKKVNEHLDKTMGAKGYIDDFVHSKSKTFKGDSKKERIKRALGAYYGAKN